MDTNWTSLCPPIQTYFSNIPRNVDYDIYLIVVFVVIIFLTITATSSNFVVIVTYLKTPSLQTPSNFLIFGLAISDFATGIIVLPSLSLYKLSEYLRNERVFCPTGIMYISTSIGLSMISFLTLSTITLDRFLAIYLHLRYEYFVTAKRYAFLLILYWCFGIFLCVCRVELYSNSLLIGAVILFVFFLLMDAAFIFKVSKVVRRHSAQIQAQHQSTEQPLDMARFKKSINIMFFVVGAFVICYIPLVVALIAISINSSFSLEMRGCFTVAELFLMLNAVINPVIYCLRIKEIRVAFKRLLPKKFFVTRESELGKREGQSQKARSINHNKN